MDNLDLGLCGFVCNFALELVSLHKVPVTIGLPYSSCSKAFFNSNYLVS